MLLVKKNFKVENFRLAIVGREDSTVHYTTQESHTVGDRTETRTQHHYKYVHRIGFT